ncbi:putative transposase [Rickettsia endosymbiont of Ixodes pacificus]|nr:putative transposase [Rickettsia endosymbiont of Ixodes pacificus]
MVQGMQIGRNEGMQIGKLKAYRLVEMRGNIEVAKNMYNAGSDISFISKVTGLSISELNNLLKSKS